MKKIGLITLNGYFNYGNRLQNYALQEVLKSYKYEVDTIWVNLKKENTSDFTIKKRLKQTLNRTPKDNLERIINKIKNKIINKTYKDKLNIKRREIFKDFSNKYINETKYKIEGDEIYFRAVNEYEYFVTGSDQVWNPQYKMNYSAYFLRFAPVEKRVAYAPSFGVSEIPNEHKNLYSKWINGIEKISIREDQGAKIIEELTGQSAPILVDPTLLLKKKEWLSIAKIPSNKPKNEYLLTYFLGDISLVTKKYINKIAKKYDLQIVNLAQEKDKTAFLSGPSEFIDYVNTAKLFITDSFHGGVFSILLETPFIIFDREGNSPSMNSRITTLLSKFNYENRHINEIKNSNNLFDIEFTHVENIVEEERNNAFRFLNKALEVNNK